MSFSLESADPASCPLWFYLFVLPTFWILSTPPSPSVTSDHFITKTHPQLPNKSLLNKAISKSGESIRSDCFIISWQYGATGRGYPPPTHTHTDMQTHATWEDMPLKSHLLNKRFLSYVTLNTVNIPMWMSKQASCRTKLGRPFSSSWTDRRASSRKGPFVWKYSTEHALPCHWNMPSAVTDGGLWQFPSAVSILDSSAQDQWHSVSLEPR